MLLLFYSSPVKNTRKMTQNNQTYIKTNLKLVNQWLKTKKLHLKTKVNQFSLKFKIRKLNLNHSHNKNQNSKNN